MSQSNTDMDENIRFAIQGELEEQTMNHCKLIPVEEVEIFDCEFCEENLKVAKQTNATHIWVNQDGHVASDPNKLEDREATNRKYGLE